MFGEWGPNPQLHVLYKEVFTTKPFVISSDHGFFIKVDYFSLYGKWIKYINSRITYLIEDH